MKVSTPRVSEGDWVVIEGHSTSDLGNHTVTISGIEKAALYEGDKMLVRCPPITDKTEVFIDGVFVGYVRPLR